MASLERRIAVLEKIATPAESPRVVVHFFRPGHGTVALRDARTGREVHRLDDEGEAKFLARAALVIPPREDEHGN
ncbi:MAG: hypothetical protein ABIR55_07770 [Burkholderiaceae bacterium]